MVDIVVCRARIMFAPELEIELAMQRLDTSFGVLTFLLLVGLRAQNIRDDAGCLTATSLLCIRLRHKRSGTRFCLNPQSSSFLFREKLILHALVDKSLPNSVG